MTDILGGTPMETVIVLGLFILSIVIFALVMRGLDIKKWSSWLYGAIIFGCYFIIGFLLGGIKAGLELGGLFHLCLCIPEQ